MKKAILNYSFSMVQWFGEDYGIEGYEGDAYDSRFEEGEEVFVLFEGKSKNMYKQYVIYSEKNNSSAVIWEGYLDFID